MAEDSPFLRLPTEIRLQIYAYLYEPPEGQYPIEASLPIWGQAPIWLHRLELYRGDLYPACNSTKRAFWPILQVCKTVNKELLDLLFERMLFTIFMLGELASPTLAAGPPKLGRAKNFTFWHRARRVVLVTPDATGDSIKCAIHSLGTVLRCFRSSPQETAAYVYFQQDYPHQLSGAHTVERRQRTPQGMSRGSLKSFSSLSKRVRFNLEVHIMQSSTTVRERAVQLAEAANAPLTLVSVIKGSFVTRPGQEHVESKEIIETSRQTGIESIDEARPKRVVCHMSKSARFSAARTKAIERKMERLMKRKQLFEGRLG